MCVCGARARGTRRRYPGGCPDEYAAGERLPCARAPTNTYERYSKPDPPPLTTQHSHTRGLRAEVRAPCAERDRPAGRLKSMPSRAHAKPPAHLSCQYGWATAQGSATRARPHTDDKSPIHADLTLTAPSPGTTRQMGQLRRRQDAHADTIGSEQ